MRLHEGIYSDFAYGPGCQRRADETTVAAACHIYLRFWWIWCRLWKNCADVKTGANCSQDLSVSVNLCLNLDFDCVDATTLATACSICLCSAFFFRQGCRKLYRYQDSFHTLQSCCVWMCLCFQAVGDRVDEKTLADLDRDILSLSTHEMTMDRCRSPSTNFLIFPSIKLAGSNTLSTALWKSFGCFSRLDIVLLISVACANAPASALSVSVDCTRQTCCCLFLGWLCQDVLFVRLTVDYTHTILFVHPMTIDCDTPSVFLLIHANSTNASLSVFLMTIDCNKTSTFSGCT